MRAMPVATVVLLLCGLSGGGDAPGSEASVIVPLGHDAVVLGESKVRVQFSATVLAAREVLDRARWNASGLKQRQKMSGALMLRVTAETRPGYMHSDGYPVDSAADANAFMLGLTFRARVCRGLEHRTVQPRETRQIGMPADVPYDERVFNVIFDLKDVEPDERIMFEVLSPQGERVAKFYL